MRQCHCRDLCLNGDRSRRVVNNRRYSPQPPSRERPGSAGEIINKNNLLNQGQS